MELKGLILSGGHGTRLRPLTFTRAKQLIPVGPKPVLYYAIEDMVEAGIRDIGIVIGDTGPDIVEALGDGSRWGVKLTFIYQEEPLGLAHAVRVARHYLGDHPFVMYLGDNILKNGIRYFVERFEKSEANAYILLARVAHPEHFGVAQIDGDRIIRLIEKPKVPPSDLALVGVYLFDNNVHSVIETLKPSHRGEYEITDAIQGLIDRGLKVQYEIVKGWWKDTGRMEDLLEANRLILQDIETRIKGDVRKTEIEGPVWIEEGATVIESHLRGPCYIGKNCHIERAYIGPFTSIHDKVTLVDIEVEYSIVFSGSSLEGIPYRIEGSVLGQNVQVRHKSGRPQTMKLLIGDQSWIYLP